MNGKTDFRRLNLGVALLVLGIYFILARQLHFRGPGPILLLIGTILLGISALRGLQGPIVPAGVLIGLGSAFLLRDPLERWMPGWATMLMGIGAGLLFSAGLERVAGRDLRRAPLVPGIILVSIALVAALLENLRIPESFYDSAWRLWPWVLVAAGVILVVRGVSKRNA